MTPKMGVLNLRDDLVFVAKVGEIYRNQGETFAPPRSTSGGAKREHAVSLSHGLHIGDAFTGSSALTAST